MRNILYFVLAVVTALSTTGVAQAAGGGHGHGHGGGISNTQPNGDSSSRSGRTITCTDSGVVVLGTSTCQTTLNNGHNLTCTITSGSTCTDTLPGIRPGAGGQFGGRFSPRYPYPGLPMGFPQLLPGNLLSLEALGVVGVNADINVCMYPSFTDFDAYAGPHFGAGWAMARNRWFQAERAQAEWLALRQAAGCSVALSGDVNLNGYLQGQDLLLNQYGINGLNQVNLCAYQNFNTFDGYLGSRLGGRWGGRGGLRGHFGGNRGAWEQNYNRLRMQVGCPVIVTPASSPVIEQPVVSPPVDVQPMATPAPVVTPDPSPAITPTPPSGSTIIEVPQGSPATGDSGLAPNTEWVD